MQKNTVSSFLKKKRMERKKILFEFWYHPSVVTLKEEAALWWWLWCKKMFLFRRGQTLSCPLPRWRHSWYRPVVTVTSAPPSPPPTRPHPFLLKVDTDIKPTPPSLDDDTLKIQPFKHRYSNKLSNIQYVIQRGFDHFTECTSKNTWTASPIYRGHSNSQRLARDTSSWGV